MDELPAALAVTPTDPTNVDAAELSAEKLTVQFQGLAAISDVSLTVRRHEIFGLIGPNGAGKTTLVNCLTGFQAPTEGRILVGRQSTAGWEPTRFREMGIARTFQAGRLFKEMSVLRKRRGRPEQIARLRLSLMPEGRRVFGTLTVAENLQIGGYMLGDRAAARSDMERLLGHFPRLRERLHYPAGRLSGGEQQMLAVARAVMTRPRLLLVDEPSLGLAPEIIDQIYEILLELRRREKLTLLLNEQSSARVLKFADRIYVLKGGAVGLEGRAADLRDGEAIRHTYFGFGSGENPRVETTA